MNEGAKAFSKFFGFDFSDHFFKKPKYHKLHGFALGNTTLHHVKEFLGIYISGRCSMRAFHIVGKYLKTRQRVCFGGWIEKQIAVGLICIGLLGIFSDFDQAGENGACIVEQCIFVE
jgi:hypothetical protein